MFYKERCDSGASFQCYLSSVYLSSTQSLNLLSFISFISFQKRATFCSYNLEGLFNSAKSGKQIKHGAPCFWALHDICQFYLQMWFWWVVSHSVGCLRDHNQITVMVSIWEYSHRAEINTLLLWIWRPLSTLSVPRRNDVKMHKDNVW